MTSEEVAAEWHIAWQACKAGEITIEDLYVRGQMLMSISYANGARDVLNNSQRTVTDLKGIVRRME